MQELKAGVIGCGFFTQNHLAVWDAIEDVALAAVCDQQADRANAAVVKFNACKAYADAEEMLANEPLDFVDIVTTPPSHRLLMELAARYGRHVICQKPMAPCRWKMPTRSSMRANLQVSPLWSTRISDGKVSYNVQNKSSMPEKLAPHSSRRCLSVPATMFTPISITSLLKNGWFFTTWGSICSISCGSSWEKSSVCPHRPIESTQMSWRRCCRRITAT